MLLKSKMSGFLDQISKRVMKDMMFRNYDLPIMSLINVLELDRNRLSSSTKTTPEIVRLANVSVISAEEGIMSLRIGALLNSRWKIGARHALYHVDGTWYHQLTRFPGALCDPYGYVLFKTEDEFRHCPKLQIHQDVHIQGHISEIPGYVRVQESQYFREVQ